MGQMVSHQGDLYRINTSKNSIEYSTNNGRDWHHRQTWITSRGILQDLTDNGNEILLMTSKGLFFSNNQARDWHKRS